MERQIAQDYRNFHVPEGAHLKHTIHSLQVCVFVHSHRFNLVQ